MGHVETRSPRPGVGAGWRRMVTTDVAVRPSASEKTEASGSSVMTANAPTLARKYRLELFLTHTALLEFGNAKQNSLGGLDYADFYRAVCRIFGTRRLDSATAWAIYQQTGMREEVNVERFLEWQRTNKFSAANSLTASEHASRSDELLYQLANDFSVTVEEITRIKKEFERYDADHSGSIDFDEFRQMLEFMLNTTNSSELPLERVKQMWREIDRFGTGHVYLSDFTSWFFIYFNPEDSFQTGSSKLTKALQHGLSCR